MKKYIFCKAWELVQQRGFNISEALKRAWKIVKNQDKLINSIAKQIKADERYTLKSISPELFENFDFAFYKNGPATRNLFIDELKKAMKADVNFMDFVGKRVKHNAKAGKQFISLQY